MKTIVVTIFALAILNTSCSQPIPSELPKFRPAHRRMNACEGTFDKPGRNSQVSSSARPRVKFSHDSKDVVYSVFNRINVCDFDSGKILSSQAVFPTPEQSIGQIYLHPKDEILLIYARPWHAENVAFVKLYNYRTEKILKSYDKVDVTYNTTDVWDTKEFPIETGIYQTVTGRDDPEVLQNLMEFQHPLDEREVEILKIRKFNRSRGVEAKQLTANGIVDCIAGFHPDGKRGLFLCHLDLSQGWHPGVAAVVDLDSGKVTKQYVIYDTDYPSAAFSPCGQYLCIGSMRNLLIFDLKTDRKVNLIPGCADKFLTYSEDSTCLFTGGAVFSCLEVSTGKMIWNTSISERGGTTHGVRNIIYISKANKLVCSTEFNDIFIADSLTGKVLKHFRDDQFNHSIDFSEKKNTLIHGIENDVAVFPDFLSSK